MKSISLNGILTYPFQSKIEVLSYIKEKKKILIAVNAEKIINKNEKLKEIINSNIGYQDGIGAVMALKKKGFNAVKIPGVELWLEIIKENYKEKSFYLIGASQAVITKTVQKLKRDYDGIDLVGYHNGFFDEAEKEKIHKEIIDKKPDVVFVAMGSPRQEYFMNELIATHPALYMGLGGSFDVYTGNVKRAPKLFQVFGLEWSYRLIKQPSRIFRQIVLVRFLTRLLLNRI